MCDYLKGGERSIADSAVTAGRVMAQVTALAQMITIIYENAYAVRNIFSILRPFASSSTSLSRYRTCRVNGFSISSTR